MRRAPNGNPKKKVFYGNFLKFKSIEEIVKKNTSFIFIFVQFILTAIGKGKKYNLWYNKQRPFMPIEEKKKMLYF